MMAFFLPCNLKVFSELIWRNGINFSSSFCFPVLACGLAVFLFFLAPFFIPAFGFSLHVFPVLFGALLIVFHWRKVPWRKEYGFFVIAGLLLFLSSIFAPAAPVGVEVKAWLTSMAAFLLCAACFHYLRPEFVARAAEILLALTAAAAIGQVSLGYLAYVPGWFGLPRVAIYATGLTIYSSQASIMFLPLLMFVLWGNINKPAWYRYVLWGAGCAGVYYTLSRAGWLAFAVGLIVFFVFSRKIFGGVRRLLFHLFVGGLACGIAWALPTSVDCYEPKGDCSADRWAILSAMQQQALDCHSFENCIKSRWVSVSDFSAATRWVTLQVAIDAVRFKPLTGVGLGRFPDRFSEVRHNYMPEDSSENGALIDPRVRMTAHNGYAQLAAEAGLPVFFAFLAVIVNLLYRSVFLNQLDVAPVFASVVGVLVWLIFHDGFSSRLLWILLGCLSSYVFTEQKRRLIEAG